MKKLLIVKLIVSAFVLLNIGIAHAQSWTESPEIKELGARHDEFRKSFKGFSFRGILVGASLDDQMPSCEVLKKKDDTEQPKKRPEPKLQKWQGKEWSKEDGELCYKISDGNRLGFEGYEGSYDIENLPYLGFHDYTRVSLIDDKVEAIIVSLSDEGSDKMLILLKEKYGKPKTYYTRNVQNRMNAKFKSFIASWVVKRCELLLASRVSEVDDGYLLIQTNKYKGSDKRTEEKKKKAAIDKL